VGETNVGMEEMCIMLQLVFLCILTTLAHTLRLIVSVTNGIWFRLSATLCRLFPVSVASDQRRTRHSLLFWFL
jgi:hypothetical protein